MPTRTGHMLIGEREPVVVQLARFFYPARPHTVYAVFSLL